MSGFKIGNLDLDTIFKVESNSDTRSTGYKLSDGSDLMNRYRIRASNIPQGQSTGYTTTDENDLSYYFVDQMSTTITAIITITASAGQPVIPSSVMHSTAGITSYSVANGAVLEFEIDNISFGQQLKCQRIYGGSGGFGVPGRNGSRGGHSYAVSLDDTLLGVAGAGGGCGAGNGFIGASAYYDGLSEPNMTIDGYVSGADRFWYGLNAKYWYNHGGGGGTHEDTQTAYSYHYKYIHGGTKDLGKRITSTDTGSYLHGGDGGSIFKNATIAKQQASGYDDRRSSGGGGGGAGYIGGGGATGILTGDGKKGSPGGGSGSSYLNQSLCTFNSLTKNAAFGNEEVKIEYLYTVSGESNNTRETITVNADDLDGNGLYVKTF